MEIFQSGLCVPRGKGMSVFRFDQLFEQRINTAVHYGRRFFGKSQRENRIDGKPLVDNQVSKTPGKHKGFPGPRTGGNDAIGLVHNRGPLFFIQSPFQKRMQERTFVGADHLCLPRLYTVRHSVL